MDALQSTAGLSTSQLAAAAADLYLQHHSVHGSDVPNLPALLPEVWLHWDPKTVHARGKDALRRFRMDFLLLLPRGRRVVLEVDGKHHYSTNGQADPALYAKNMRADRNIKLSDYDVFRFGADEPRTEEQARTHPEVLPRPFPFVRRTTACMLAGARRCVNPVCPVNRYGSLPGVLVV